MSESQPAITISDELDDMLDPDILDLRQFTPLGDVVHVDLVKLPPQPTVVRGWTLTQVGACDNMYCFRIGLLCSRS